MTKISQQIYCLANNYDPDQVRAADGTFSADVLDAVGAAQKASAFAHENGSAEAHERAAKLHRITAKCHADAGNDEAAACHEAIARGHDALAACAPDAEAISNSEPVGQSCRSAQTSGRRSNAALPAHRPSTLVLTNDSAIDDDGWGLIAPFGEHPKTRLFRDENGQVREQKFIQVLDNDAADAMVAKENSFFRKLKRAIVGIPVYKGHGDLNDADPAAISNETKKIKLGVVDQIRKTTRGIEAHFALDNEGAKAVEQEDHKYPSAFWWVLPNGTRGDAILAKPFKLISVALTPYKDAFIFWSAIATLMAGHWPHGEAAPPFGVWNTINRDNIIKEFNTNSEGWWGTANSVAVSIQDVQAAFKSRPCLAPNLFNMAVTKRLLSQKIDRPFITRYSQGLAWATEYAKIAGDQTSNGAIEVQSEKCTAIQPGSLFLLTDDQFGTSEVQRCTKKVLSAPPTGTAKITHETERGVAPQPYAPTQTNPAQTNGPSPSLVTNYQLVQLPTSLVKSIGGTSSTSPISAVALLAGRPSGVTTALEVWFQQADQSAYQLLGTNGAFAVAGSIYSGSGGEIITTLTTNTQAGASYNLPPGATAFGGQLYVFTSGGVLLGSYTYGTDYTFDLINNIVTLTSGTTIPAGSTIEFNASQGVVATSSATPGNTYSIPQDFWGGINVWYMASGASFSPPLGGGSHATEGTDYLIDPVAGTLTILSGGAIGSGDAVFVFFTDTLLATFASNTPASDLDSIMAPLTLDEVNDNTLLIFAFKAANPSEFEIMSVVAISAGPTPFPPTAPGYYNIEVKRQQFGTTFGGNGTDFAPGDLIFIIPRAALNPLTNEAFEGLEDAGSTASFILAPQSAWVDAQTNDLYDPANNPTGLSTGFTYTFNNIFGPAVTWIQQLKAASGTLPTAGTTISSFPGAFLTTDQFYFSFQLNAGPGANIISASLQGMVGEQQTTLWSNVFTPSAQVNAAAQFSLTTPGLWSLSLNVLCDDGSQTSAPLTLAGGSSTPVQIQVNTSSTTYVPTPTLKSYEKTRTIINTVKLSDTTGLTVKYQLQNRGTAYNPSSWTALTESPAGSGTYIGVANYTSGAKTLYAYAHDGVNTDSPIASWNL